jgi:hypothetical protein
MSMSGVDSLNSLVFCGEFAIFSANQPEGIEK